MNRSKPTAASARPMTHKKAYDMRKDGVSWRSIENKLRLHPAHGMTAVRCVKMFQNANRRVRKLVS